ncbi:phosphopantetheine-binding protein [Micromonospora sp. LOL_014]|uniref:phosphopantetheine-binding protein n=1 Tax=Micromonospora sp. LOL_014 TaxID=3345415 RepID=UPI003A89388E
MSDEIVIKQFIVSAFAPDITPDQLPTDLDLLDSGIVDSLGLLRLIAWVVEQYGITIDDRDISPEQFSSVEAITKLVHSTRSSV